MKAFQGGLRTAFVCFFASHIPITICIDGQAFLTPYYPRFLRDVVAWYCDLFGDILMRGKPSYDVWFSSIVACELLFQMPFFFCAVQMLRRYPTTTSEETPPQECHYPAWFRSACLVYGSHVSTTLVPILASFLASDEMTTKQKCMTILVYSPYLIFPILLLYYAVADDFPTKYVGSENTSGKKE